jgi:hypothetical protein
VRANEILDSQPTPHAPGLMPAMGQERRFDYRPATSGVPQLQTSHSTTLTVAKGQQQTRALQQLRVGS